MASVCAWQPKGPHEAIHTLPERCCPVRQRFPAQWLTRHPGRLLQLPAAGAFLAFFLAAFFAGLFFALPPAPAGVERVSVAQAAASARPAIEIFMSHSSSRYSINQSVSCAALWRGLLAALPAALLGVRLVAA